MYAILLNGSVGAVIGAAATVATGLLMIQAQQKQLVSSEQYTLLRDENAKHQRELSALAEALKRIEGGRSSGQTLEASVSTLVNSNLKLQADFKALQIRYEALLQANSVRSANASQPQPNSSETSASKSPPLPSLPVSQSAPTRSTHRLQMNQLVRMTDGTSLTLNGLRGLSAAAPRAAFMVNGQQNSYASIGQRFSEGLSHSSGCYFEFISLEGGGLSQGETGATVEYVCSSR